MGLVNMRERVMALAGTIALEDVRGASRAGDLVLCKGSRVAALEAIAEALR